MTRRRWMADEVAGDRAFLAGKNADHLSRVLRARVGQRFEIATPEGVRLGEIVEIRTDRVVFSLGDPLDRQIKQHTVKIHLYLAIFKFDRMEWAIEKCTELGVDNIVPLIARRTEVHLASAARKRAERWRRIAHEAAQQSRRDAAPEISDPVHLDKAVAEAPSKRIVLAETEQWQSFAAVAQGASELSLAVGPEGGWTNTELDLFRENAWISTLLGPTILRAETAAITAIAVAQALA